MNFIKYYFIFNPVAGDGKKLSELIKNVEATCEARGLDYEVYLTKKEGDAINFVKSHCEVFKNKICRFYACGGDGTISEVVNGAASYGNAEFGVIPVGTGNDFVRNFGERKDFFDIGAQLDATPIEVDLIKCNDRYSINMINIGFDCEVAKSADEMRDNSFVPQKMAYIAGIFTQFGKMSGANPRVRVDDQNLGSKELLLVTIANGAFCGGGFHSSPEAYIDDGRLDIGFIKRVPRMTFLSLVGAYKNGTLPIKKSAQKYYDHMKCCRIVLDFDKPQNVSVDGEIMQYTHLDISAVPRAIKFALPKGLTYKGYSGVSEEPSEEKQEEKVTVSK